MNALLNGLQNYIYTLVTTATSTSNNPTPDLNRLLVTYAVAMLTAQFIRDPTTQYKDDGFDIIQMDEDARGFDFIVVGSGAGGSVIAGRLSEASNSVLLIEAGCRDPPLNSEIILMFSTLLGTKVDWNYFSSDTNVCRALKYGRCPTPRGQMLCGTAALNAMFHVRGNPQVYNDWQNVYKCDGWSYNNTLPYFKMLENNSDSSQNEANEKFHGKTGPMKITSYFQDYGTDLILNGIKQCGFPEIKDINVPHGPCVCRINGTIYEGRRHAPCKAYINPHQNRPNLKIMKCATVIKVLFNKNRVAIGVLVHYHGKIYKIKARREVILCAGAFGTPMILQISGIGRAKDLNSLGIAPLPGVPELDVGHYLWDHVCAPVLFTFCGRTQSLVDIIDGVADYYHKPKSGMFTGLGTAPVIAYFDIPSSNGVAIIECYFFLFEKKSLFLPSLWDFFPYNDKIQDFLEKLNESHMLLWAVPMLLSPKSSGRVFARTKDHTAYANPDIFYNFLSDPFDKQALIEAIELLQSFPSRSQIWKDACAQFVRVPLERCDVPFLHENSKEYHECLLKHVGASMYHPCGTARMGSKPPAVCNSKGEVFGVSALRVADASIFPYIVDGNTCTPTIMVAEKIAGKIKKKHGIPFTAPT